MRYSTAIRSRWQVRGLGLLQSPGFAMFNNIQMLRAFAASLVLIHHAGAHYQAMGGIWGWFSQLASVGFAGVDVFFVISGFVAAHTTFDKARSWSNAWHFARRRLARIYLGYWPFLAAMMAITWVFTPAAIPKIDVLGSVFLTTIKLDRLAIYVTWSLTFELLFYALVSATLLLPMRQVNRLVYLAALGVFASLVATYSQAHSAVQIFTAMLFEFLAGMLIYMHRQSLGQRWLVPVCALLGGAAFVLGARLHATDGSIRIFTFGLGAVAWVTLAVALEQTRTYVANRVLVALGDASYTLYLSHLLLLAAFYFMGLRDFLAVQSGWVRETGFFLFLAFCLWFSHLLYIVMERPLYRWAVAFSNTDAVARVNAKAH